MIILLSCLYLYQATETVHETRKVSFKQEEVHVKSVSAEMSTANTSRQQTQVQEQTEQQGRGNTNRKNYVISIFSRLGSSCRNH